MDHPHTYSNAHSAVLVYGTSQPELELDFGVPDRRALVALHHALRQSQYQLSAS